MARAHTHKHTHAGNWNVTVSQEKGAKLAHTCAVTEEYDSFAMQLGCAGYTGYTGYTHMQFAGT